MPSPRDALVLLNWSSLAWRALRKLMKLSKRGLFSILMQHLPKRLNVTDFAEQVWQRVVFMAFQLA